MFECCHYNRNKRVKKRISRYIKDYFNSLFFLIYSSTLFFRTHDDNNVGYNLKPFWSYEAINEGLTYLWEENVLNILFFISVGILFCLSFNRIKWWRVLFLGGCFSLSIELFQLLFNRGYAEFDDVFHNTLGCAIGIMIVAVIKGIKRVWLLPNHNDNASQN